MKQGDLIPIKIIDLNTNGEGVGRIDNQVVFVPNSVTGDLIQARITQVKAKYALASLQKIVVPSQYRIRPRCIVADKCGGCQWQHIDEAYQREAKQQQVVQTLQRIGGFNDLVVEPILHTGNGLNYRNKSTYPMKRSQTGKVQAGYYRQGSHKIVNLNQCPVQNNRLDPLLKEIKEDIYYQGWTIYDETTHQGQLRHLSLRMGTHTGEILLTLVSTDDKIPYLERQAQEWLQRYPSLKGVCLNLNSDRTNAILGKETITIAGQPDIKEIFAGIELRILAHTFFQINTIAAEMLLDTIIRQLNLQGNEILVDAYCGIGTFTLPLAKLVKNAIGIESLGDSVIQAQHNAKINQIDNVEFMTGKVANCLQKLNIKPDIVVLDPPRKGCNTEVIDSLLSIQPAQIVYISCKPATLARDLKLLVNSGIYQLKFVRSADFFPQTTHVETVAIIEKI